MREFVRVMSVVVMMVAAVWGGVAWVDEKPGKWNTYERYGLPALAVLSVAWFVYDSLRRDRAPDFLKEQCKSFFDSGGLSFVFVPNAGPNIQVYFQNQYSRPCRATLALRPARGEPTRIAPLYVELECPGGGYGIANRPIDPSSGAVARTIRFEVGASIRFPDGKGRRLRFRTGTPVRYNAKFRNALATLLEILSVLSGPLFGPRLSSRQFVQLSFPSGCSPAAGGGEWTDIVWQVGNPIPGKEASA
jgi:hypothetical protein